MRLEGFIISRIPFSEPLPLHATELLTRARQFRVAALPLPDIENARPNWPKYALVFHAIELALKAAIVSFGERNAPRPPGREPGNHDLCSLYDYATDYGLVRREEIHSALPHISELHMSHYARYPRVPVQPVALISQYDDLTDQILADVAKAIGAPSPQPVGRISEA